MIRDAMRTGRHLWWMAVFLLPWFSSHAAAEPVAGPVCARWILVIFGSDPAETGARKVWAPDTMTATHLQMPLEWLGYELEFRSIMEPLPKLPLEERFAGVIIDSTLEVPHVQEGPLAQWLADISKTGLKTLLTGSIMVNGDTAKQQVMDAFHLRGTGETINHVKNPHITKKDTRVMHGETELKASRQGFNDVTAPPDAEVFLALEAEDDHGVSRHFDAAFRAPWGGVLFDPYVVKQFSPNHLYQLFDPFAFVSAVFGVPDIPVPDTTTRDGLRMLFSHIDGDGFNSLSNVGSHQLNAEVVRDEILKKYPIPVTVSVIEASMRGLEAEDDNGREEDYVRVAREIFALPHVRAASHTFSHPFTWIAGDDDSIRLNRAPRNLVLRPSANYPEINYDREVTGSLGYVNQNLLPRDHKAELLLWSGNCRPPPEALAAVRKAGALEMNGGNTIISKRWKGLAGISPRIAMMDGELQVYAPAQNEMFYTDDWKASYLGGFANVIETFEMTGAPRRLKPVNIYYHFYSGERGDALAALKKVEDWAMSQPLHAVNAADYVRAVHDARDCVIRRSGRNHWIVHCDGSIRTFRLPAGGAFPRVGLETGVSGWNDDQGVRYIHTTGAKEVEIELARQPSAGPVLVSSTGEVIFHRLDEEGLDMEAKDLRPVEVTLRMPDSVEWRVHVDGKPVAISPKDSLLKLKAPPVSRITVSK